MNAASSSTADSARRLSLLGACSITFVAAGLRFWGLDLGLPNLEARPDETQVVVHSVKAAQGDFAWDWAIYPHAYVYLHWLWGELLLWLQALLGIAGSSDYAAVFAREPARLYWIGRALTACAGVATVWWVMAALRRRGEWTAAALAGAIVATSLLHVRDSHALKPDVLMTLGVTLAVLASARLAGRTSIANGVLAGLAVGAAAAAKYNGVIAAVPVCAAAWLGTSERGWRRALPLPLVAAGASAALAFAATSPLVLLNDTSLAMLQQTLNAVFPQWVSAPEAGPLPDLSTLEGPDPPAWATSLGRVGPYWYHAAFSMWHGMGVVQTLAVPVALGWALLRGNGLARFAAIFSLAWLLVIGFSPVMLSRYLTPALPSLAIVLACFAAALLRFARRSLAAPRARALALAAVATALVAEPAWDSIRFDRLAATTDTRVEASRWMAVQLPKGARVAVVGTRFWAWGAPQLPPQVRPVSVGRQARVDPRRVDYVVAHDHPLFWSSVEPVFLQRNAARLRPLAEFSPFEEAADGTSREEAVFEANDAYYLPISGFSGVTRPGPRVTLFEVR